LALADTLTLFLVRLGQGLVVTEILLSPPRSFPYILFTPSGCTLFHVYAPALPWTTPEQSQGWHLGSRGRCFRVRHSPNVSRNLKTPYWPEDEVDSGLDSSRPDSHYRVHALPHASCCLGCVFGTRVELGDSLGGCFGLDTAQATPSGRTAGRRISVGIAVSLLLRVAVSFLGIRDRIGLLRYSYVFPGAHLRPGCPNRPCLAPDSTSTIPSTI
jgi:hypothetical protein